MGQAGEDQPDMGRPISDEELKKMSAFHDFIDTLDLEDFDKRKS